MQLLPDAHLRRNARRTTNVLIKAFYETPSPKVVGFAIRALEAIKQQHAGIKHPDDESPPLPGIPLAAVDPHVLPDAGIMTEPLELELSDEMQKALLKDQTEDTGVDILGAH